MSDTRTLMLTIVGTSVGLAVLLTGVMFALIGGVNARIDNARDDLSTRMDQIETRLDGFDERLRNVEIAFGKVDQRLLTIERVALPSPGADE